MLSSREAASRSGRRGVGHGSRAVWLPLCEALRARGRVLRDRRDRGAGRTRDLPSLPRGRRVDREDRALALAAGRVDQNRRDGLEQRHHLGDAPQSRVCRAGCLRQDARDRRARPRHASIAPAATALRPDLARACGARAVEADRGTGARDRRAVRTGSTATGAQPDHLAAQHQAPVAAAGDPRLSPLRLRVLPLLDAQQEREAARVLPLLGHRRPPPPRRARLREPTGPPRRGRRARLEPSARAARGPDTDPDRDRSPASNDACDAPCYRASGRARARPRPRSDRAAPAAGRLPGAADHARGTPRSHVRAAQTRGHRAGPTGRARRRPARRRDLPQAHRNARRLPRAARRQRREPDRRPTPTDHPARRPRGADRRRRRHDPPLHPDPHRRPTPRLSTAFR